MESVLYRLISVLSQTCSSWVYIYIYPTDSKNFDITDYGICINEIRYWLEKGSTPFVDGDLNSRPGDLNMIASNSLKWRYDNNIDQTCNINGIQFANMCELLQMLPLNHTIYGNRKFDGSYTYFKANKKSQIDFVLIDNKGRRLVREFKLVNTKWHHSDHLPLHLHCIFF